MDHELKQRLIGAIVVTALAAIFIPMLFDDPVDTSGNAVKELTIPPAPVGATPETSRNLPVDKAQVLNRPDIELNASEVNEDSAETTTGEATIGDVPTEEQSGQESPGDVNKSAGADSFENEPGEGIPSDKAEDSRLDTGIVHETDSFKNNQNTKITNETTKKLPPSSGTTTEKPVPKPEETEITKSKSVANKPKAIEKSLKDTKKPSSKLVRYSIQAGSFSKRENAQALVDKLRKQGMPATITAKGDLFRVKVGPSLDRDKAKEMKAKLDKQNIKGLLTSE
jgi:DedD protein